jgi:hypothetical protein
MSVRVTTDVFCDACGRWAHYTVRDKAHVQAAQRGARKAGWTFDRKGDCKCPECNGTAARGDYWGWLPDSTPTLPRGTAGVDASCIETFRTGEKAGK